MVVFVFKGLPMNSNSPSDSVLRGRLSVAPIQVRAVLLMFLANSPVSVYS